MKKSIIYETPDGQKFTTRRQALQHETNLTRRAQITRFLLARTKLKQVSDSVTVEHVIEILCAAAEVEGAAVLAAISAGDFTRGSSDNRKRHSPAPALVA